MQSEALLMGRLYDDRGNRMGPTHARKNGIKYRYYLSSVLIEGRPQEAGSISRVPAAEVETAITCRLREHFRLPCDMDDKTVISKHVGRVDIRSGEIVVLPLGSKDEPNAEHTPEPLRIAWQKPPSKRRRELLLPASDEPIDPRPIRSETRATLIEAISRGRRWLDELTRDPAATAETIARREGCSSRKVNMTISLAFLSPALVKAALEGRLARGVGVTRLCDMPAEWSRQHESLGLSV
jgi:hypothetical protein